MFSKVRSWFSGLSGPKRVAAIVVAVAGGIGVVVGAINGSIDLYNKLAEPQNKSSLLELVDVSFTKVGENTALDVKLTNVGKEPVIITRATINVKKTWTLEPPYFWDYDKCPTSVVASSYNYKMRLPTKGAPYTVSESLSQGVGPNKNDRFTITLGRADPKKTKHLDQVFLMTVSLVYGADEKTLLSKPLLYADPNEMWTRVYDPGECKTAKDNLNTLTQRNKRSMAEIQRIEAPSNTYLGKLAKHIL